MPLRIGRLPYLHAEPFYFDMPRRGLRLVELVPRALSAAALRGEIDAGPVPIVDVPRLQERFRPLAGFCLASLEQAGSTLLFSTKPLDELDGAAIAVCDEAATALSLLRVVLELKYHRQHVTYVALQQPHQAILLIGNEGLRRRTGVPGYPYTYDLGSEWYAWTGLPFVFARWMVRQDIDDLTLAQLEEALHVGVEEGVDALYQLSQPRAELFMLPRDVERHIQGQRYYLGRSEQQAMVQFQHYLSQLAG